MSHGHKLSELKANIRIVIENINILEGVSNASPNDFDLEQSLELGRQTTSLLEKLTELPCEQIANTQLKRKRRRQRDRQKSKLQRKVKSTASNRGLGTALTSTSTTPSRERCRVPKPAEHITLKKQHDSTNMLQAFDLLERLYKARGGERCLSEKLARLRTVWRRVQQESSNALSQEVPTNCEAEWAKAVFGNASVPLKQGNLKSSCNTQDFIERRTIWDSYISTGKVGSSIPHGWVLPTERPTAEWSKYKCE